MVQLNLNLEKNKFFPSDLVNGKIILKTKTTVNIDLIEFSIKKLQILVIQNKTEQDNFLILKQQPEIKKNKCVIILNNQELSAGTHEFPFMFYVPCSEGASTTLNGVLNDIVCYFENNTVLEISCKYDSKKKVNFSYPLTILNRLDNNKLLNIRIKIKQTLCFYTSKYFISIYTDKEFYYGGENVCVTFCPSKKIDKKFISQINASIYEVFMKGSGYNKTVRSRQICENKMEKTAENTFKGNIKLPFFVCATFSENDLLIRVAIFFVIKLVNGEIMRIKKYINVGRTEIIIPNIEEESIFDPIVHEMKIIEYI